MIVLALDTCQPACSVAVVADEQVRAAISEPMTRGHQERLAPMAQEAMAEAGVSFSQLDRIGVTVGPGSFTGLRVGLAFAKGLALALERPCAGVTTLEALAASAPGDGFRAAAIDAGRGQIYLQIFDGGRPLMAPDVLPLGEAAARLAEVYGGGPGLIVGTGARLLAGVAPGLTLDERAFADPVAIARLAAAIDRALFAPPPLPTRAGRPDDGRAGGRAVTLRPALAGDAGALAALHTLAFDTPWSAHEIAALMASPGGYAWLAEDAGFILCRAIAGEAEILTLAVAPDARRRGVARALVETAMAAAAAAGTTSAFLEVAESNAAAIALYQSAGFAEVGRRPGYYAHTDRAAEDALVLRRDLLPA